MKKLFFFLLLCTFSLLFSQEKTIIKGAEITIPIGKKLILNPKIVDGKIESFGLKKEEDIKETLNMMSFLTSFEKDNKVDNSIEINFSKATMGTSESYILYMIQKTGKKLTYKAKIRLKDSEIYTPTSIVPVISNAASFEQWRNNIDSIFLYDFVLEK